MKKYTIATIASHSSLQILKGAKDEGFHTLAFCLSPNVSFYKRFPFIDEIIPLKSYKDFAVSRTRLLRYARNDGEIIIIPHGSFVAYLGKEGDKNISLPYFGSRKILDIEADRVKQYLWLQKAGLTLPRLFHSIHLVDRPVIVKYHGAQGGSGYFIAADKYDLKKKLYGVPKRADRARLPARQVGRPAPAFIMQEYIIGVPVYFQYFYSPLSKQLELMGIDRRYETDVDGIGRIPSTMQEKLNVSPTFTVIGNMGLVVRESLLPAVYEMGERVVEESKKLEPRGLWGPFCLETIITPDQKIYVIEISCRIVAGTNLYINGSPYTDLLYNEPMSTGRRIAREIKEAIRLGKLKEIVD